MGNGGSIGGKLGKGGSIGEKKRMRSKEKMHGGNGE